MKLLIVDDQQEVGAIVGRIAQQTGWECVHTTECRNLIRTIRAEKVDAILLDYAIEGSPEASRNGLTVVSEMRSKGLTIPVMLFTGWMKNVDQNEASRLDVFTVLEKPLGIRELRQALGEARKRCDAAN